MKKRLGFVSNSSSCSFVIKLNEIKNKEHREKLYQWLKTVPEKSPTELMEEINAVDVNDVYNRTYTTGNEYHLWISRDESMYNEEIDDLLWKYNINDGDEAIFNYHY